MNPRKLTDQNTNVWERDYDYDDEMYFEKEKFRKEIAFKNDSDQLIVEKSSKFITNEEDFERVVGVDLHLKLSSRKFYQIVRENKLPLSINTFKSPDTIEINGEHCSPDSDKKLLKFINSVDEHLSIGNEIKQEIFSFLKINHNVNITKLVTVANLTGSPVFNKNTNNEDDKIIDEENNMSCKM